MRDDIRVCRIKFLQHHANLDLKMNLIILYGLFDIKIIISRNLQALLWMDILPPSNKKTFFVIH